MDSFISQMNMRASANDVKFFTEEILEYTVMPFHEEWLNNLTNYHRNVFISPRDHGKSTIVSLAYPLWVQIFSPIINPTDKPGNYDVMLISNSLDQSTELISRIKVKIEDTEILQSINWSRSNKSEIRIEEKGNHNRITSKAFGSSIRGAHPFVCVVDDPLSEKSTYSNEYIEEFFFSSLSNMMKNDAYLSVVGTRFSYNDLYSLLMEPERGYQISEWKAFMDDDYSIPLWPERYSKENLLSKRREIGEFAFSREFMCQPIDDSTSIFPSDLVKGCIDTRITFESELDPDARYIIAQDFSIGTKTSSDYSVIIVLKDDLKGSLTIVDMWRENQVDYKEQIDALLELYNKFKPIKIFVENNVFQAVFQQILAKMFLPVIGVTTSRQSKERDIYKLHSLMENKILVLPKGDNRSRNMIERLELELLAYGYKNERLEARIGHDDCVMALAIAVYGATSFPTQINDGSMFVSGKTENILNIDRNLNINNFAAPYSNIAAELGI